MNKDPRPARSDGRAERDGTNGGSDALVHRDGHRVRFVDEGTDEVGEYLRIEHIWPRPGPMAGPHWHPVLTESFTVEEGRMRFRVDGREFMLSPGGAVTVRPGEVHRFWNEGEGDLCVMHEIRPPLRHRAMFELWHRLDLEGKTNRQGVPTNPLALGLLWERQDGYVTGLPASLQGLVFGGLARLARLVGYEDRWESRLGAEGRAVKETQSGKTPPRWLKAANRLIVAFQRLGLVIAPMRLLSVPGRRSGKLRTTPVSPLSVDGERYVVALFEGADWVENARAGGWGILAHGGEKERVTLVELPPEERGPVLREFPGKVPQGARFLRQRYGIPNDPEAFAALAPRCPVFRVEG